MDIYELTKFTEETVTPYLERQSGVASVTETGLVEKTVEIRLNEKKIEKVNNQILGIAVDKLDDAQAELKLVARALLPEGIQENSRLKYELLEYSICD